MLSDPCSLSPPYRSLPSLTVEGCLPPAAASIPACPASGSCPGGSRAGSPTGADAAAACSAAAAAPAPPAATGAAAAVLPAAAGGGASSGPSAGGAGGGCAGSRPWCCRHDPVPRREFRAHLSQRGYHEGVVPLRNNGRQMDDSYSFFLVRRFPSVPLSFLPWVWTRGEFYASVRSCSRMHARFAKFSPIAESAEFQ